MATNPSTWHVSDLLLRIDATPYEDPHALVCPNFQRGPVWGYAKKQAFIRSARSGWPVGTLLVHDEPRSVGNNVHHVYQLVDGLQRTVTLREYERAPFAFLSTDQYSQEHLSSVRALLAAAFPTHVLPADEVDDAFVAWLKEKKSTSLAAGYTQNELYEYLCRTLQLGEGQFDSPSWGELLTNVEAHVSLASYSNPGPRIRRTRCALAHDIRTGQQRRSAADQVSGGGVIVEHQAVHDLERGHPESHSPPLR